MVSVTILWHREVAVCFTIFLLRGGFFLKNEKESNDENYCHEYGNENVGRRWPNINFHTWKHEVHFFLLVESCSVLGLR